MTLQPRRALVLGLTVALATFSLLAPDRASAGDPAHGAPAFDQPMRRISPGPGPGQGGGPYRPGFPVHPGGPGGGSIWKGKTNGPLEQCVRSAERTMQSCERGCRRRYQGGDTGMTIARNGCLSACQRVYNFTGEVGEAFNNAGVWGRGRQARSSRHQLYSWMDYLTSPLSRLKAPPSASRGLKSF